MIDIAKPSKMIRSYDDSAELLKRLADQFGKSTPIILDTILKDTNAVSELTRVFKDRKK